jgi:hypothetical protein
MQDDRSHCCESLLQSVEICWMLGVPMTAYQAGGVFRPEGAARENSSEQRGARGVLEVQVG